MLVSTFEKIFPLSRLLPYLNMTPKENFLYKKKVRPNNKNYNVDKGRTSYNIKQIQNRHRSFRNYERNGKTIMKQEELLNPIKLKAE